MTARFITRVGGSAGEIHQAIKDGHQDVFKDFIEWIAHWIHTVFSACVHFVAEFFETIGHVLSEVFRTIGEVIGPDLRHVFTSCWSYLVEFVTFIYQGLESIFKDIADSCSENSTCSSIFGETKRFVEYCFRQLKAHFGFGFIVLGTAVVFMCYIFFQKANCCCSRRQRRRQRINHRTGAHEPLIVRRQNYASATGTYAGFQALDSMEYARTGDNLRKLMAFAFAAVVTLLIIQWCVVNNPEDLFSRLST